MPFTFVVAREIVEGYEKDFLNHPVGTGPFMLSRFNQSGKIIYVKNPDYRKKFFPKGVYPHLGEEQRLPFLDKIVVHVIKESQPRWLNFLKGKIDYIAIPRDNFDSVITPGNELTKDLQEKGVELLKAPSLDITYVAFNHDLKLFASVDLRRAMMLAYDIDRYNKLFYNNTALPAHGVIPPGIAGYEEEYENPYRKMNIKKAKELLTKAGYPGGKGIGIITYDCFNASISRQQGDYFKKQMEKIGIQVKVRPNPWPVLQDKITKRKIMTYGIAWGADYPDAENFLQLLYGPNRAPGANGSGYDNKRYNLLFERATAMSHGSQRTKLYETLNRFIATEVPWIFGVHRQNFIVKHSWVENFTLSDFNIGQEAYLSVDTVKKKEMIKKL